MKKIISFVLILSLIFSISAFAVDHITKKENAKYPISEPYQYPIVPETDAWLALESNIDKIDACVVPDEIIAQMSTDALLETFLTHPLATNIFAYKDYNNGFDVFKEYYHSGLAELVQREDIKKSILKAYNKIEVYEGNTDRSTKEYKKAVDNEWRTKLLEVIVAQLDSFTDSDTHILIEEAIYNSSSMKLKNPDFYGKNSTVYYKTLKSKYGIDSFSYYVYDIYTPNGTQVVAQYIEIGRAHV